MIRKLRTISQENMSKNWGERGELFMPSDLQVIELSVSGLYTSFLNRCDKEKYKVTIWKRFAFEKKERKKNAMITLLKTAEESNEEK